jgi:hypothetical protein
MMQPPIAQTQMRTAKTIQIVGGPMWESTSVKLGELGERDVIVLVGVAEGELRSASE